MDFLEITAAVFVASLAKDMVLAWYVNFQTKKLRRRELGKLEEVRERLMRAAAEAQDESPEPALD